VEAQQQDDLQVPFFNQLRRYDNRTSVKYPPLERQRFIRIGLIGVNRVKIKVHILRYNQTESENNTDFDAEHLVLLLKALDNTEKCCEQDNSTGYGDYYL
jgi:hypothetical protein